MRKSVLSQSNQNPCEKIRMDANMQHNKHMYFFWGNLNKCKDDQ